MEKMTNRQKAQDAMAFVGEEQTKIVGAYINTCVNPSSAQTPLSANITIVANREYGLGVATVVANEVRTNIGAKGYDVGVENVVYGTLRDLVEMESTSAHAEDFDLATSHIQYDPDGKLAMLQKRAIEKMNRHYGGISGQEKSLEEIFAEEIAQPTYDDQLDERYADEAKGFGK